MRLIFLISFTLLPILVWAGPLAARAQSDLVVSSSKGAEFQLEVRQMPLAEVLKSVAEKTQVPIHYSVLPEGLVTATCVGATLKPVLECLLNRKADLIVRYQLNAVKAEDREHVVEAWILGSRLENTSAQSECPAVTGQQGTLILLRNDQTIETAPNQIAALLKITRSKNAAERADAIGSLLTVGHEGDPTIKAALEQALHDSDANVRAQAVSTLSHREGNAALGVIQEAMRDESVDVRLMAVDGIIDDVGLLQQAVNDSDETIRTFAAQKLEQVLQKTEANP
jgi:hypothetical protein